jgi:hypothetical protein
MRLLGAERRSQRRRARRGARAAHDGDLVLPAGDLAVVERLAVARVEHVDDGAVLEPLRGRVGVAQVDGPGVGRVVDVGREHDRQRVGHPGRVLAAVGGAEQPAVAGPRVPDGGPVVGAGRLVRARALGARDEPQGRGQPAAVGRDRVVEDDRVERRYRPAGDVARPANAPAPPVEEVDVAPALDRGDDAVVRVGGRAVGVAARAVPGDRALALAVRLGDPDVAALDEHDAAGLGGGGEPERRDQEDDQGGSGAPPSHVGRTLTQVVATVQNGGPQPPYYTF